MNQVSEAPVPPALQPTTAASALALANPAMTAEIQIFSAANHLSAAGLHLGSKVALRVVKFPEVPAYLEGPVNSAFFNPVPLTDSPAWAPWAAMWREHSAVMELYLEDAAGKRYLFHTFTVQQINGVPGPKTAEGDLQVPEGFYAIGPVNMNSQFLIDMPVLYNASNTPGMGDGIEIHGTGVSVGCLAMGNIGIAQIASLAPSSALIEPFQISGGKTLSTFLSQMTPQTEEAWGKRMSANPDFASYPDLSAFWNELREQDAQFMSKVVSGTQSTNNLINIDCD